MISYFIYEKGASLKYSTKNMGSRADDGKRFLESNASSILGTLT